MFKTSTKVFSIACALVAPSLAQANIAPLATLIEQEKYPEAWKTAQSLKDTYEGDPRFDFFYGVAALETGNYDQAVFALDRVVVHHPGIIRPRLELARAYLKLNNDQAALKEFRDVLQLNPPARVRQKVNAYIQQLGKRSAQARQSVLNGMATITVGYDSNMNAGVGESIINTPIFGNVTLKDSAVAQDSAFTEVQGQAAYRYIQSPDRTWFVKGKLGHKRYAQSKAFSTSEGELEVGTTLTQGQLQYQVSARHQALYVDEKAYNSSNALEGVIARDLSNGHVVAASLTLEDIKNKQQALQDNQRIQATGQYRFTTGNNTRHQVDIFAGHEHPEEEAGRRFSRDMVGGGYSAVHTWNSRHSSSVGLNVQQRQHQAKDPIYNQKRKDTRVTLQIGHQIRVSKNTSVFAEAGHTDNDSNLGLYDTDKRYVKTGINYHF